jgi:hypothetical protein
LDGRFESTRERCIMGQVTALTGMTAYGKGVLSLSSVGSRGERQ